MWFKCATLTRCCVAGKHGTTGLADVRGGGGPADTDTPKRWYDDTPGAKIPVADMAAPEKVGPILKEGGYRRANKNDRSGMMRTGTENAPV